MDSLVSLVDQVIPGSPALAILTAVLLLAAGWIARKAAASMRRQGARLGAVEKVVRLERSRRRQVEQCLRERGIPLPYNPEDPPELYLAGPRYVDDDQDHDDEEFAPEADPHTARVDTPAFSRHRLNNRRSQ
jgi:hypothetical protein